eukprot:4461150-Pleurochrysis_carterae.AAC.1
MASPSAVYNIVEGCYDDSPQSQTCSQVQRESTDAKRGCPQVTKSSPWPCLKTTKLELGEQWLNRLLYPGNRSLMLWLKAARSTN